MTIQAGPERPQLPGNAWPSPVHPRARGARPELSGDLAGAPVQPTDWARLGSTALRYRWWILALAGAGTLGGVAAGRVLPPRYQVQATIWIQSSEPRGTGRGRLGLLLAKTFEEVHCTVTPWAFS